MKLEDIEKLCESATEGPWKLELIDSTDSDTDSDYDGKYKVILSEANEDDDWEDDYICDRPYYNTAPRRIEDARFIAMSRDLIPKFCKLLRAYKEQMAYLHNGVHVDYKICNKLKAKFEKALEEVECD